MDQRIIVGGEDITDAFEAEFNANLSSKIVKGNLSQLDIAKLHCDTPHNMIDGMGEVQLSIDEELFHAWRLKMKEEMKDQTYECWDDKDFCKFVHKNFPECRGSSSGKIVSSKGLGLVA